MEFNYKINQKADIRKKKRSSKRLKKKKKKEKEKEMGPVRESNPGPLAPKARIMPLDQQASHAKIGVNLITYLSLSLSNGLTYL